jgi:hypothetical protein
MNHNRKRFIIYLIDSLEGFQELTAWMAFGVVFIWPNPGPGDKQPRASVFSHLTLNSVFSPPYNDGHLR